MFYESYGASSWLLWGALLAAATASPVFGANALMAGRALPTFLELLGPKDYRTSSALAITHGLALIVTILIGTETALSLVFDPGDKDFPLAALTMAAVPFASMTLLDRPKEGIRPAAESIFAGLLFVAAIYTGLNEGRQRAPSRICREHRTIVSAHYTNLPTCSELSVGFADDKRDRITGE